MMKIFSSLGIAVKALLSHRTRTFLASLGVLIGIGSVIVMVAIGKGSQKEVMDVIAGMGENLITVNAGEMKRHIGRLSLGNTICTESRWLDNSWVWRRRLEWPVTFKLPRTLSGRQ